MQDPLYLSPLTTCNRNVEMLVQRHSHLRSLTSWAKCLRNAPCQCTAHAAASSDIWLFKSESVPRTGTFSPDKHEISIRNKEPEGYQLRYYILRFAGRLSWSITFRLFTSYLNFVFVERKCPSTRTVFWFEKPNIRPCCCVSSALTRSVPKTLCPTC